MLIWVVWGEGPIATFSSEERARAYIARNGAEDDWSCSPVYMNPGDYAIGGGASMPRAFHGEAARV